MKSFLKYSFFICSIGLFLFSCNKDKDSTSSCDTNAICYTIAPDSLWVKLNLSPPSVLGETTKVKFYFGNMDDGKLYDQFQTTESEVYYLVPVKKNYTATAEYVVDKDTILVINSNYLNRKSCENGNLTCYDWDHQVEIDLKLKK